MRKIDGYGRSGGKQSGESGEVGKRGKKVSDVKG